MYGKKYMAIQRSTFLSNEQGIITNIWEKVKVPGHAWLEWNVKRLDNGDSLVTQQALFVPKGVLGRAYWYALLPAHVIIFSRMLNNLIQKTESNTKDFQ